MDNPAQVFENCKTYRDGAVNPSDFANIVCRTYKLNHNLVMNSIATDGEGRYTLKAFMQYLQLGQHNTLQANAMLNNHTHSYYEPDSCGHPPSRPSSGSKNTRQNLSHYHHTRNPTPSSYSTYRSARQPISPTVPLSAANQVNESLRGEMLGAVPFRDNDDSTPDDPSPMTVSKRQLEMTRNPEHCISAEEKTTSRTDHDRMRQHTPHNSHPSHAPHSSNSSHTLHTHHPHSSTSRNRPGTFSRSTVESPPFSSHASHHPPGTSTRRMFREGRSDKADSCGDDSCDDGVGQEPYHLPSLPPAHSSRSHGIKKCKNCDKQKESYIKQLADLHDELKLSRSERVRLAQNNERLRKNLHITNSADVASEQLRQENNRLRSEMEPSRSYYERQYEELKRAKEDALEECSKERSAHRHYKKEYSVLKSEYSNIRLKNEELQRSAWQLKDENQKLTVRLMEEDEKSSPLTRRSGGGSSEENPARPGDTNLRRQTNLRQAHHFSNGGKTGGGKDSSSRSHRSRVEMKRTSSEGKAFDLDEPVMEAPRQESCKHPKAKTYKSAGTSDVGSVGDNFNFSLVSSIPDEQAQVFMVLNEDVSKSVLPEGLPKDQELALIYGLQNCHSIQELIKRLFSHGVSTPSDKLTGFQVENDHLKLCEKHLCSKLHTMTLSFENTKIDMIDMYHRAKKFEANNTRLRHALSLCQLACEVYEVLLECMSMDSRMCNTGSTTSAYFPSFDSSLDAPTRSPDRETMLIRNSLPGRVRVLLAQLEANPELQSYLPYDKHGMLSQNTGTTSGLSSMSGGTDIEITSSDVDRLRLYTQALMHYEKYLVVTMVSVECLNGLSTVKKQEKFSDSPTSEQGRGEMNDMEDAAHAEELCKVREEKAELKSQIYMMEQEKRRMELEVGRLKLQKIKSDKLMHELRFQNSEERRKRKKERKRKGEAVLPSHDSSHMMSELSIEYSSALEREKELGRRYEDLFSFLQINIKVSQETTDDLMRFVKELRQANTALVDAFEKSKKRQLAEKRRMKHELMTYMNRWKRTGGLGEEPVNGSAIYT